MQDVSNPSEPAELLRLLVIGAATATAAGVATAAAAWVGWGTGTVMAVAVVTACAGMTVMVASLYAALRRQMNFTELMLVNLHEELHALRGAFGRYRPDRSQSSGVPPADASQHVTTAPGMGSGALARGPSGV